MSETPLLGDMLKKIVDDANLWSRTQWAEIIWERDSAALDRWICNLEIPSPERLVAIHSTFMEDCRSSEDAKDEWEIFLKRPLRDVTCVPCSGQLSWWPRTIEEYMLIPLATGFLRCLNTLFTDEQKRSVLYRASEHVRVLRNQ